MRPATIFREYIWLVSTIRQAGKITFSALNDKWVATAPYPARAHRHPRLHRL